jgi:hypothetical protein
MMKKRTTRGFLCKNQGNLTRVDPKQLEEDGWVRQFVGSRSSVDNTEKVYDLLGFEVLRLPVGKPGFKKTISFSSEKSFHLCEVVYVRPKKQNGDEEENWA